MVGPYDHLREVTRDDVLTALNAFTGLNRQRTLVSLRSLFGFSKKSGVVFPLPDHEIQRTIAGAARPADRLIIALAAIHAARSGGIRAALLEDIDLGNRRLTTLAAPGRSTSSPDTYYWSGWTTGEHAGPTPPTRTC